VQDAHNVIEVALVDREAAVVALGHNANQLILRAVHVEGLHAPARRHDLADGALAEVEDVADERFLIVLDETALDALGDDQFQLLGRHQPAVAVGRGNAHQPQQQVADAVEQAHRVVEDAAGEAHQRVELDGHRRSIGQSQRLGDHLADDDVEIGQQRQGDDVADRARGGRGEPAQLLQVRLDKVADSRLGVHGQPQRSQGDAQLRRGDVVIELRTQLQHVQHVPGHDVALVGHLLHLRVAHANDGELGGDEDAIDDHQDQDNDRWQDEHRRRRQRLGRGHGGEQEADARQTQAQEQELSHVRPCPIP